MQRAAPGVRASGIVLMHSCFELRLARMCKCWPGVVYLRAQGWLHEAGHDPCSETWCQEGLSALWQGDRG